MRIKFLPNAEEIDKDKGIKILVAARQAKATIRFGCAACSCGLCAVKISKGEASQISDREKALLDKIGIYQPDDSIRLACQARVEDSDLEVDLSFQDTYSPEEKLKDP